MNFELHIGCVLFVEKKVFIIKNRKRDISWFINNSYAWEIRQNETISLKVMFSNPIILEKL